MPRKLKVFLCHSSHDKPAVRELYARLKSEGWIDPWLDEEKLYPGQDWDREIEIAVEESESVLILLSKESVEKESYVQYELRSILHIAKYKPAGVIFVLPLRINKCEVPRSLKMWQHIDYFPEDRKDWAYKRILGSLKMRAEKLGIDVESIIAQKTSVEQEKAEEERRKKIASEKARKERIEKREQEKAEQEALEKARKERETKEKKEAEEKARKIAEKKARKNKEVAVRIEKARQERIAREKLEAEEKASKAALRKELQRKRKEYFNEYFSRLGKLPYFIGGGIALLLLFIYIISSFEPSIKPEPTKIPTTSIPVSAILVLPTATSLPTSTSVPTKTSTPTKVPATPTPILGVISSTMVSEKDGMTLLYVPAGEFLMGRDADDSLAECEKFYDGCNRDWFTDEEPIHTVYLDAYWIDQTEVTNAMYDKCVADGKCDPPSKSGSNTRDSYYGNPEFADYPVIYVSWNDATNYCTWVERRLPIESEWEKAAGWDEEKQSQTMYPWGNIFDETKVNFCDRNCGYTEMPTYDDGYIDTSPVSSYPTGKSFYGIYNMLGNVEEWVDDWFDVYPGGDQERIDFGEKYKAFRGNAFAYDADFFLGVTRRSRSDVLYSSFYLGFRCAMSADEP